MNKKKLTVIISFVVGLILLLVWLRFVDFRSTLHHLRSLKIGFVVVSALLYLIAHFVRAIRWRMLLSTSVELSMLDTFIISMGGNFTNYLIPLRAGDFAKCYFIKKMKGNKISQTISSVFIDKLYDMIGVIVVFVLLAVMRIKLPVALNYLLIIITFVLGVGLAIIVFSMRSKESAVALLKTLFFFLPKRLIMRVEATITTFVDSLNAYKRVKGITLKSIILSIVALIIDSLFFYSLFLAFGVVANYFYVLLGYTLIYLSYVVPHPPAQIGSNELLMVLIFSVGFGMQADLMSSIMIFSHILTGFIVVLLGAISYSYAGVKIFGAFNKGEELE